MTDWVELLIGVGAFVLSAGAGWPLTAAVLGWAAHAEDAGVDGVSSAAGAAVPTAADETPDDAATSDSAVRPPRSVPDEGTEGGGADVALPPRAVLRGGTWIGMLERLAVTGCLIAGYPAGIAFVIAVKGLGRYPELREHPGLSERFVIGTLASMGWAALVGAAARGLLV